MLAINPGRMAGVIDGDFVIFVIGARINKLHAVRSWWPVVSAMPKMVAELGANRALGLLHVETSRQGIRDVTMIQYWRSFDALHTYARARESEHLPAWAAYNRLLKDNDAIGIWHETYLVRAGEYEAIYGNMPARGLGVAGRLEPATGVKATALGRLGRGPGADHPAAVNGTVEA